MRIADSASVIIPDSQGMDTASNFQHDFRDWCMACHSTGRCANAHTRPSRDSNIINRQYLGCDVTIVKFMSIKVATLCRVCGSY